MKVANTYITISDAYSATIRKLLHSPEFVSSPRGQKIYEISNYSFSVLDPTSAAISTLDPDRNEVIKKYYEKEKELYNSCSNTAEDFVKASKFWDKLKNPDNTINSAYGYLIWKIKNAGNSVWQLYGVKREEYVERTQWDWAKESLLRDKDSRQAVMHFNLPTQQWFGNKDFTCTMHVSFMIRENRLNLSIVMRSNDIVKGSAYDWPWFSSLSEKMVQELKPSYPDLEIGKLNFLAHSMHLYEKDLEIAKKMIGE